MTLHAKMISLFVVATIALAGCAAESDIESPEPETSDFPTSGTAEIVSSDDKGDVEAAAPRRANLTNFESYPDPDSEECREYNGCTWAGYFAFVNGRKSESWVRSHNIIAVHQRDAQRYKLKTFRLTKNGRSIDAKVYDMCADSDCNGCCTRNARSTGFLIDIEKYTMQRFGSGSGTVEWTCLDC